MKIPDYIGGKTKEHITEIGEGAEIIPRDFGKIHALYCSGKNRLKARRKSGKRRKRSERMSKIHCGYHLAKNLIRLGFWKKKIVT